MDRFIEFANLYQETAKNACDQLKRFLKVENPMNWRQANIPKSGRIGSNMECEYLFHGTDCKFKFRDCEIDFEFGYDGRVGGFSEWKLFCFAEDGTDEFPEFRDEENVKKCIEEAKCVGLIEKPYLDKSDDLYYLSKVDVL